MKRLLNITFILVLLVGQFACVKDPLADLEDANWNNERSILEINFENQVGAAEIERVDENTGIVNITINADAVPNFTDIKLNTLQLSFEATANKEVGDGLNFENDSKSATLMVMSPTGKSREYTIHVESFNETLLGTYKITNLVVYGGTGPEYGGAAVTPMMNKPWIWTENDGPSAELDNTLTFTSSGITEDGNTYGVVTNDAGEDGKYADFVYIKDPETDLNHFYRRIPEGEGKWLKNYTTGMIEFTFDDETVYMAELIGDGEEDMGNGKSKTTTSQAFAFNLQGTDDWNKIYSDYDKFVKRPRRYWIDVEKQ